MNESIKEKCDYLYYILSQRSISRSYYTSTAFYDRYQGDLKYFAESVVKEFSDMFAVFDYDIVSCRRSNNYIDMLAMNKSDPKAAQYYQDIKE